MSIATFERFFRAAAGLDADKSDLRRYEEFVAHKVNDLLIIPQATANANGRDVIMPADLPVTKGLPESMHQFRELDEEIELRPILEALTPLPPDVALSDEARERLPMIVGGLSLALARTFTIVDPNVRNPQTAQWERVFRIFDLLL